MTGTLIVERATAGDAGEIAELFLASRQDALPYLARIHRDDEVRAWVGEVVLPRLETWVARERDRIVGFLALDGDDLDQLYVLPGHYRQGIGARLLAVAKERSPARLRLFAFQRNMRARAFWEANGFRVLDMNDGDRNEEKEPDIHYEWRLGNAGP
ncbi:MAG: GNAT family N-acetyltransferase [Caulobacteraceae bacterium]